MSSTSPLPSLKSSINLIIATMSVVSKIVFLALVSKFNLELSFTLPTSDKSYLSFLKYKLLNISSAISKDGASPGLKTLYMSFNASVLFVFLSTLRLSRIYGPLLIGSIFTIVSSFSS